MSVEMPGGGTLYTVGQPYNERIKWPEGADFNYRADQIDIRIFWASPRPEEVERFQAAPIES